MDRMLTAMVCLILIILLLPVVTNMEGVMMCFGDEFTAKYYMDSFCFDMDYRCDVECSRYGREFTGIIEGCSCDCGDGWVSSCSGFYYSKDPDGENMVRITGDEEVVYPNGTKEPFGVDPGIYKFNKTEPMIITEGEAETA